MLLLVLLFSTRCLSQIFERTEEDISRQLKKNETFQLLYSPFENNVFIEKHEKNELAMSIPVCNM
jgi:hypothetical protein